MKKFFTAAIASLILFGGQVGAAIVDLSEPTTQTQKMSAWPGIRDNLLGRNHNNRHRRDWNRHHHHNDRHRHHPPHRHGALPPRW